MWDGLDISPGMLSVDKSSGYVVWTKRLLISLVIFQVAGGRELIHSF